MVVEAGVSNIGVFEVLSKARAASVSLQGPAVVKIILEFFILVDDLDAMLEIRCPVLSHRREMTVDRHLVRCSQRSVDSHAPRSSRRLRRRKGRRSHDGVFEFTIPADTSASTSDQTSHLSVTCSVRVLESWCAEVA